MERPPLFQALFLQKTGHEVTVFASVVDQNKCYPEITRQLFIRPYLFSLPPSIFGKGINHALSLGIMLRPSALKNFDVAICHVQPSPWIGYAVKRRYQIPYIHYAQGICRQLYPREADFQASEGWDFERKVQTRFLKMLKPLREFDFNAINNADAIVANSRHVANEIKEIYGRQNVVVSYPGVDLNEFKPLPFDQTANVIKKFSICRPFLFTTNRHESHKRLDWLIQIMPLVVKEYPSATLVITGSATRSYTPLLHALAKKLKVERNVVFTGVVSEHDLVSLYNQSDLYLFSPPQEDFGLGPVEAMACGTPVVAWDRVGPKETVADGVTGFLARSYNLDDFAEKVLHILSDGELRRRMEANCFEHIKQNFTWKRHMKIIEKVLARI
jgi:glycosyltransferase involved in cell wall biosynthesis